MTRNFLLVLCFLVMPVSTNAQTANQTCESMIGRDNSAVMSKSQCLCFMKQGNKYLDPRVVKLWREALYYKESRMDEIVELGISKAKLTRQMRKLARGAKRVCGINM